MAKMTATIAKELLLPVPKDEFITSLFSDTIGKCCAIGHLVRLTSKDPSDYKQSCDDRVNVDVNRFARITVRDFNQRKHNVSESLAAVNNHNDINGYSQNNPKDRVMALLDDMINEEK
jgi:hypothetical protein